MSATEAEAPLPEGWELHESSSRPGLKYYVHKPTGRTKMERPTEEDNKKDLIRCSHIIVKHKNSRRPSSWKEPNITRTEDEALLLVKDYRKQITSGEIDFATLAQAESDCSSAKRGGDLGWFERGQMQPSFEAAAFAMKVGELSEPVFTDSGVHLILRTG